MRIPSLPSREARHRRQRGVAAVEFALVIIMMLLLVAGVVEFGRVFWHYDALAKATRDAARTLSTWPKATVASAGVAAARNLAVVNANAAALSPALETGQVQVECLNAAFAPVPCVDGTAPANVRARVTGYAIAIGAWVPFIGVAGMGTPTLAPHTTMRYMN